MRFPFRPRVPSASLGAAIAVYALGIAFAVLVAGYGIHRVAGAVLAEFAHPPKAARPAKPSEPQPVAATLAAAREAGAGPGSEPTVVREAAMTLTQDRWPRSTSRPGNSYRPSSGQQFGTSSRGPSRPRGFFDGLFGGWDWDRPPETYRTVCVRLCDGYYFPVSFSAGPERFERDRQVCENSCGTQGRLFIYRNPGGELGDMQDLQGRPYRQLRTAFLYRTEYVADCKCQPRPWEEQATDRHRAYALVAAKRKGDKAAAAELAALGAKMRQKSGRTDKTAGLAGPAADYRPVPGVPPGSEQRPQGASEAELMRLGAGARKAARVQQEAARQRPNRDAGWSRRDFWKDF